MYVYVYIHVYTYTHTLTHCSRVIRAHVPAIAPYPRVPSALLQQSTQQYAMATISRLLKIIGLFCKKTL